MQNKPKASSARTRQWIQVAVLLLLGLYFLETLLTGEIAFYINERFNWLALVGGIIFLLLGIAQFVNLVSERDPKHHDHADHDHAEHEHDHAHDHDHDHAHHGHQHGHAVSWPVLAVIAVPLALGILVPARPLGAAAISGSGIATSLNVAPGQVSQQFAIAPAERNVLDWVRAFSVSTSPEEFTGQQGDLLGFVYRDARFSEAEELMVTRFTVSCCVADAVAIGVVVITPDAANWQQDTWVRVRGTFQVREFDGRRTPVLIAESIEPSTMPDRPYLFP